MCAHGINQSICPINPFIQPWFSFVFSILFFAIPSLLSVQTDLKVHKGYRSSAPHPNRVISTGSVDNHQCLLSTLLGQSPHQLVWRTAPARPRSPSGC
ncbi:uncharacterized protein BO87DRAFT_241418 [Aspergillus neoniger CBS 115656]|uniref:Uncharacterized protein n=1 Tax=Aspergillus neoniger (strain CBS 115656) TaxID=1448310 RepID=A0A318YRH6_ASPNB|nr:hypothetical protein BO87DRAFT_241418 [Aspergillus neoniger CBS 115656]PYH36527.1 hypothetical protein BO87DRAFT_241418 [Aspergillus neoniger CBS 115656]